MSGGKRSAESRKDEIGPPEKIGSTTTQTALLCHLDRRIKTEENIDEVMTVEVAGVIVVAIETEIVELAVVVEIVGGIEMKTVGKSTFRELVGLIATPAKKERNHPTRTVGRANVVVKVGREATREEDIATKEIRKDEAHMIAWIEETGREEIESEEIETGEIEEIEIGVEIGVEIGEIEIGGEVRPHRLQRIHLHHRLRSLICLLRRRLGIHMQRRTQQRKPPTTRLMLRQPPSQGMPILRGRGAVFHRRPECYHPVRIRNSRE